MENDYDIYYVVKTIDKKYDIITKRTNQRVLFESYDLILPIIYNRYAIVANKSRRRFKEYNREVTEKSYRYHAFDLFSKKEILPLKDDYYSFLYLNLNNQTIYYSLESDTERTVKEKCLNGRAKRYSGPVKIQVSQYNYLLPKDPRNKTTSDYVSPERNIDYTGVFPHTDSKWDFLYSFLHEDNNSGLLHRFRFSCGDVNVPNAHISIINNQFCVISQTTLKSFSAIKDLNEIYNGDALYDGKVYDKDDNQAEVFLKNIAIFNEYWNCLFSSQMGFHYSLGSDDRLLISHNRSVGGPYRLIIRSSGERLYFPEDVIPHYEEYALESDHLYRVVSNGYFGFTNLDAEIVIPCIYPKPKYKYYYYNDSAAIHASILYDALEGDASNYLNID